MQKACASCRSRQELSNEYWLAKFGVDTAENEPLKVHLIFQPWDLIFTEPPRPVWLAQTAQAPDVAAKPSKDSGQKMEMLATQSGVVSKISKGTIVGAI